jgi:DNA-binding GntR family transcriptional regulator
MKRVVAVLVAMGTLAGPAALAQGKMDCGKAYRDVWERLDRERFAKISPEQLAGVNRMALRAFDACQAGDEQDAKALLARLLGRSGERPSPSELRRST